MGKGVRVGGGYGVGGKGCKEVMGKGVRVGGDYG